MPTKSSVSAFIAGVENPGRRLDAEALLELFEQRTEVSPVMWGPSIVGFGTNHYRHPSGREGEQCAVGFSPRKSSLALYNLINDDDGVNRLTELGKHSRGVGCLYIAKLADVDLAVPGIMISEGFSRMNNVP